MAITKKPKSSLAHGADQVDVEALINKGGTVANNQTHVTKIASPIVVRIPTNLLNRIDQSLLERPFKMPRHTWILEAILEKLEKEAEDKPSD